MKMSLKGSLVYDSIKIWALSYKIIFLYLIQNCSNLERKNTLDWKGLRIKNTPAY